MWCVLFGYQCGGEARRNQRFQQDRECVQLILFITHQTMFLKDLKDKGFSAFSFANVSRRDTEKYHINSSPLFERKSMWEICTSSSQTKIKDYTVVWGKDVCLPVSLWRSHVLLCKQDLIHLQPIIRLLVLYYFPLSFISLPGRS